MNSFPNFFFYEITPPPPHPPLPPEVKWLAPFIVKENPLKNAIFVINSVHVVGSTSSSHIFSSVVQTVNVGIKTKWLLTGG